MILNGGPDCTPVHIHTTRLSKEYFHSMECEVIPVIRPQYIRDAGVKQFRIYQQVYAYGVIFCKEVAFDSCTLNKVTEVKGLSSLRESKIGN